MARPRALSLRGNRIGGAGARVPGGSAAFAAVERLDLSANPLGDAAAALAAFPNVARLSLANCGLTDAAVEELAGSGALDAVRDLSVAWNPCGDAGVKALARCMGLRSLDLTGTRLGLAGAAALAASPHLRGLTLGENPRLPPDVAAALRGRFP